MVAEFAPQFAMCPVVEVFRAREGGWLVREEYSHTLTRVTHYSDWHRVERAIALLKRAWPDLLENVRPQ